MLSTDERWIQVSDGLWVAVDPEPQPEAPPTPEVAWDWGKFSLYDLWEYSGGSSVADSWVLDGEDGPFLRGLAQQLVDDADGRCSDFLAEMKGNGRLTYKQVRGVLNVVLGNIRGRHRYYQSRFTRKDSGWGDTSCLVCGGPLNDESSVARGVGPTCYRRALGDRR